MWGRGTRKLFHSYLSDRNVMPKARLLTASLSCFFISKHLCGYLGQGRDHWDSRGPPPSHGDRCLSQHSEGVHELWASTFGQFQEITQRKATTESEPSYPRIRSRSSLNCKTNEVGNDLRVAFCSTCLR